MKNRELLTEIDDRFPELKCGMIPEDAGQKLLGWRNQIQENADGVDYLRELKEMAILMGLSTDYMDNQLEQLGEQP